MLVSHQEKQSLHDAKSFTQVEPTISLMILFCLSSDQDLGHIGTLTDNLSNRTTQDHDIYPAERTGKSCELCAVQKCVVAQGVMRPRS